MPFVQYGGALCVGMSSNVIVDGNTLLIGNTAPVMPKSR